MDTKGTLSPQAAVVSAKESMFLTTFLMVLAALSRKNSERRSVKALSSIDTQPDVYNRAIPADYLKLTLKMRHISTRW